MRQGQSPALAALFASALTTAPDVTPTKAGQNPRDLWQQLGIMPQGRRITMAISCCPNPDELRLRAGFHEARWKPAVVVEVPPVHLHRSVAEPWRRTGGSSLI